MVLYYNIFQAIAAVFTLTTHSVDAYENFFATKGEHFETILDKRSFFNGNENNVEFTVSLDEMPDLPTWLKFLQKDSSSDAILYGTPDKDAYTIGLSIVAWNKETYETARRVIMLSVLERSANVTHEVEFKLNGDFSRLIGNLQPLQKIMDRLWEGYTRILYVEKASQQGSKSEPGLYVSIRGSESYSNALKELIGSAGSPTCGKLVNNEIKEKFISANYDIDWCSFIDITSNPRRKTTQKFNFDPSSQYFPIVLETTKWDDSKAEVLIDIVYVFIAVFVGLLLIAFITSVMFCQKEGLHDLTPREQLLHHKALRRVGAEIRNMSSGARDDLRNGFPYGKLDEDSKCGTLLTKEESNDSVTICHRPPPYQCQDSKF